MLGFVYFCARKMGLRHWAREKLLLEMGLWQKYLANGIHNPCGVRPYISHIGIYVYVQRVLFLSHFGLKWGIDFDHFGQKNSEVCAL